MTANPSPEPPEDREEDVDPEEIEQASERLEGEAPPPELPPHMENLTEWDTPPDAAGGPAPKVLPEDEVPEAEELVKKGLDEADRDQRLASSDPDYEP